MNRRSTGREIRSLIEGLKNDIPGLALRTTVMVGFPGETDADFGELVEFVEETRFDALGIFRYSREGGTAAFSMGGAVDDEVAEERSSILHEIQREISLEKNLSLVGSTQRVLVDSREDSDCECRTEGQAPEIDGIVRVDSGSLTPGEFVDVEIVRASDYDLIGRALP
jgi:ribosomal protein S12 methylthiotransferase